MFTNKLFFATYPLSFIYNFVHKKYEYNFFKKEKLYGYLI
jgi:hypothetical protein